MRCNNIPRRFSDRQGSSAKCFLSQRGDIIFLKSSTLVVLGVSPSPVGELEDEHLTGMCEDRQRLNGNHLHVLVSFHYLLDASWWEIVVSENFGLLDLVVLICPYGSKLLLLLLFMVVEMLIGSLVGCCNGDRIGHRSGIADFLGHVVVLLIY
ncbi:hypothetical protein IEQ34_010126 [Dendrobium chrysotoxum]|uniref:Uncharacterized protein n=1 Tax=Dendrobium chrysotoxum TaxID=161865 RepID=A0AAV7H0P1_DENCH|nr:hypothetical protein IEQ34_010126 [Dendrobium chrysotoxum]